MPVRIAAFEVPPAADDAFVAGVRALPGPGRLHRALRADVALRFVLVAPAEPAAAWDGGALPFTAHAAVYDVVREDGDPDGAGGAVLFDFFAAPAGDDERFAASWERLRALFAPRQGYLGARLHRSLGPAGFRFVAVVRWSSPLMYARTLQQPDVQEAIGALACAGRPALYLALEAG